MPDAAAWAFVTTIGYFGSGAATYASPLALTDDCPPPLAFDVEQLMSDLSNAHTRCRLTVDTLDGFDDTHRLIGPTIAVGHCMGQDFPPGSICFTDPALPVRGGDIVLVSNSATLMGGHALSIKIIDFLAGVWVFRGTDGVAPVEISSSAALTILGRVTLRLMLPARAKTVRNAVKETAKFEAQIPADFKARTNDVSRELANRSTVDRREYPRRLLVGPLFWKNMARMGVSTVESGMVARFAASRAALSVDGVPGV